MRSRPALLAIIFTSVYVSASSSPSKIVLRTSEVLSQPYATLPMHNHAALQRRDANTTVEGIQVNPDGTIDLKAWEEDVDKACRQALAHVPSASNPSGNCICYNIPSLDTSTGVFAADLRLYQISEPSGDFKGISAADIKVSVAYKGASASPVSPDQFTGAGMVGNISGLTRRDDAGGPKLMQLYLLVGKADQSQKLNKMTLSDWEAITLPTLTLAAKTPAGQDVNTTVSVNEASFLRGVFSQHVVRSDFAAAQASVQEQMAALANGTVAFVLPGTQLLIFPIGTIITSIWLVIGLAAYGWGTFERINYAEMYKQRTSKNKGF